MTSIATPEFIASLKSLYPNTSQSSISQWSLVAAVAFTSSNIPEAVPVVLTYALEDLKKHSTNDEDGLILVRKAKDAIFKAGLLCGYPKAINALAAIYKTMPESFRETRPVRDVSCSVETLHARGQEFFNQMYGETSENVQMFLNNISPDFEFFSTTYAYGFVYGAGVLTPAETSFSIVAALICNDTPLQSGWHLGNAMRNGATVDEVQAVRKISMLVAQACGVVWKHTVPEVPPPSV